MLALREKAPSERKSSKKGRHINRKKTKKNCTESGPNVLERTIPSGWSRRKKETDEREGSD